MFYSKALLAKKGSLGSVWVAAVCGDAALSRDQVARTDIVASVDKILSDVHSPHRILALLLLGIVRIYSKKVEYLCNDCDQLFCSFQPRRRAKPSTSTGRSMHGVLKQADKPVHAGRLMAGQQDTSKVKKPFRAARTTEISGPISNEGLSVRVETEVIVRTSVVVREARVPEDLPTFTIPERFELDSFDLEIAEDIDDDGEDHHQSIRQDILLEDEHHHAPYLYESYQRASCSYAVDSACFMPEYIALPPEVIGAISEVNNILDLSKYKPERENQNADSAWFTPVKDVLPSEIMDMVVEVNNPSKKSKTGDKSIREENLGSACFMASIPLPESQEGQTSENVQENMTCGSLSANYLTIEASENNLLLEKSYTAPPAGGFPEHNTEEHESLESPVLNCKTRLENELSPSTPEPLPEGVPGPPSSLKFGVRTPAKTEKRQVTRKRRRALYNKGYIPTERENKRRVRRRLMWSLCDGDIVLSNEIMRKAVEDASDLVQQRRKAPHTYLDCWKVAKLGSLPYTFMDPLIPYCTSVHLARITTPEAPECSFEEPVKARRRLSYELSESSRCCKDTGNTEQESTLDEPSKRKSDERTDFEALVGCHTESGHVQDDVCECNDDTTKDKGTQVKGDEPTSKVTLEKGLHESENQILLHNEALNAALDNIDEDIPMDEEHTRDEGLLNSTRTRKIARCLHKLFLDQKSKQGTNSLSLNQVLEGTKRKTSATFFYETLILKSHGLIDVNQEQPYVDIVLSATPQLEAELQRNGN